MQSVTVLDFIVAKSFIHQIPVQPNANCSTKSAHQQLNKIAVARWMMNVYTFHSKSMAQKNDLVLLKLLVLVLDFLRHGRYSYFTSFV